jgi:hypothetical protein
MASMTLGTAMSFKKSPKYLMNGMKRNVLLFNIDHVGVEVFGV